MTELMKDILQQPEALARSMAHSWGAGRDALMNAAELINTTQHLYITGIGSSWHAGMALLSLFRSAGRTVDLVEASEFECSSQIAKNSTIIVLSRSGKSIEIVHL